MSVDPYQGEYSPNEVPDGVLTVVPATAVPDGATRGVTPTHKVLWAMLRNTGAVPLEVGDSTEAVTEGVVFPVNVGETLVLSAIGATRRIVVSAPAGGGAGEFAMLISLSRQSISAGNPELEVDEGFPAYDATDPDNIVPGTDTGP